MCAGQIVYQAGDASDGIYGLAAGGLEIAFPLLAGEPVMIHRAGTGFWIADNAELPDSPRLVTLTASTDSRLLHLPAHEVRALLERRPDNWPAFCRLAALNSRMTVTLLSEALSLSVRARVCRRLLAMTEARREATITQGDLARLMGVTRGTLRRCLSDLAARGAIELGYRRLGVRDRTALEAYADDR